MFLFETSQRVAQSAARSLNGPARKIYKLRLADGCDKLAPPFLPNSKEGGGRVRVRGPMDRMSSEILYKPSHFVRVKEKESMRLHPCRRADDEGERTRTSTDGGLTAGHEYARHNIITRICTRGKSENR